MASSLKIRQVADAKKRLENGLRQYGVEGEDAFYAIAFRYVVHYRHALHDPPERIMQRGGKAFAKISNDENLTGFLDWLVLSDSAGEELPVLYQHFFGRRFREGSGKFFTPRPVAAAMAALLPLKRDAILMDPTCGAGTFLLEASKRWGEVPCCLVGNDVESSLADLAQVVLNLGSPSYCQKSFCVSNVYEPNAEFSQWYGHVDYILANPPFSLPIERMDVDGKLFSLGYRNSDALFLDVCLKLLRPGGRIVCLLPHSIIANTEFQKLRWAVEESWDLLAIIGMPEGVFHITANTTTRADIIILEKRSTASARPPKVVFAFASSVGIPLSNRIRDELGNDLERIVRDPDVAYTLGLQSEAQL